MGSRSRCRSTLRWTSGCTETVIPTEPGRSLGAAFCLSRRQRSTQGTALGIRAAGQPQEGLLQLFLEIDVLNRGDGLGEEHPSESLKLFHRISCEKNTTGNCAAFSVVRIPKRAKIKLLRYGVSSRFGRVDDGNIGRHNAAQQRLQ